jgi:integrase
MPRCDWPEADQKAWELALKPGDLFDDPKIAPTWSWGRRRIVVQSYGYWLAEQDLLDPDRPAGDRVTTLLFARFVDHLKGRVSSASVTTFVGGLKSALYALAPDHDWDWISPIYRNLKRAIVPTRQKHTRVVDPSALFELGVQLFKQAEDLPSDRPSRLVLARDGLLISLLAAPPIRVGNLASIEIGRHLVHSGGLYRLIFSETETKVGRPVDAHCPAALTPYIDRYLEVYRPLLIARGKCPTGTARLWINVYGGVMDLSAVAYQIGKRTKVAFGHKVNPHLFRDCVATFLAIHDPEHVRVATAILGHAHVSTTNRYYNQARMIDAAREHNRAILNLRKQARSWRARRSEEG